MNIAYSAFDKTINAWILMCDSWAFLKRDKKILIFPAISFSIITAFFIFFGNHLDKEYFPPPEGAALAQHFFYYAKIFIVYLFVSFVFTLFDSAVVAFALIRIRGHEPKLSDGFKVMFARLPQIIAWSIVSATVGVILRIIEDVFKNIGRFISGAIGFVWGYITYLIVPVLVVEGKGPFSSLKISTKLLRETWGEQLVGNFSFGILRFFICVIVSVVAFLLGILLMGISIYSVFIVPIVAIAFVESVMSALTSIFEAALYEFAVTKNAPAEFCKDEFFNSLGQIEYGPLRTSLRTNKTE